MRLFTWDRMSSLSKRYRFSPPRESRKWRSDLYNNIIQTSWRLAIQFNFTISIQLTSSNDRLNVGLRSSRSSRLSRSKLEPNFLKPPRPPRYELLIFERVWSEYRWYQLEHNVGQYLNTIIVSFVCQFNFLFRDFTQNSVDERIK